MTSLKTCFKCNESKSLDEFYPHPRMADGHLGKCKECAKRDVANRYRDPTARKRISDYERRRFKSQGRKRKIIEYQKRYRANNPEKYRAHTMVDNAIRDGRLIRKPCEVCGNPKTQAHHDDYSKPLDVHWLCFKDHRERHGQTVTE